MKKHTLHEIAKFASGLILGDFICLWWISSQNLLPINFLGMTFTSTIVLPGLIFDAAVFIILVHYGWHLGRTPTLSSKTFFGVSGLVFGIVAIIHLTRVFSRFDLVVGGWAAPLWLSWIGLAVTAYLSYMSFHLSVTTRK